MGEPTLDLVSSDEELPTGALRQSDLTPLGSGNDRVSADSVAFSDLLQVQEIVLTLGRKGFGDGGSENLAKVGYAERYDHGVVSECGGHRQYFPNVDEAGELESLPDRLPPIVIHPKPAMSNRHRHAR